LEGKGKTPRHGHGIQSNNRDGKSGKPLLLKEKVAEGKYGDRWEDFPWIIKEHMQRKKTVFD